MNLICYTPPKVPVPRVVLVDVDGTIALLNGRDPYDETAVMGDLPNWPVIRVVNALIASGMTPVFMSGRSERCREATETWIRRRSMIDLPAGVPLVLHMRAAGDSRPDYVVKLELFDAHVRDQYQVQLAIDDRNQVVKLWRSLGITTFQVADGDF